MGVFWPFLLVGVSRAGSVGEWEAVYDARLLSAADGNHAGTLLALEDLGSRLEQDDPLRGELSLTLAQARYSLGLVDSALAALSIARKYPDAAEAALSLGAQIESIQKSIKTLPYRTDFSDGINPFVHSWLYPGRGVADVSIVEGDPALSWANTVQDRQEDQIVVSLRSDGRAMRGLSCRLKGEGFPSWLRVVVVDDQDREFASEPFLVGVNEWKEMEIVVSSFHHTDPTSPWVRLDPRRLVLLAFHDVTAYLGADRGKKEVWLDDLEVW